MANDRLVQALCAALSGVTFVTGVAGPELFFSLHRHVTRPSERLLSLKDACEREVKRSSLYRGSLMFGIDSYQREAVLVHHRGIKLGKNFIGMNTVSEVTDKTLVSLC